MGFGDVTPERLARQRQRQEEAARRYATKRAERGRELAPAVRGPRETPSPARPSRRKPRRNDGPWAKECRETYGDVCIVPGCGSRRIEWDHIHPKGQGGKNDVRNGIPLCGSWSETIPGGHHQAKTDGLMKFDWAWLTPDQRAYLAKIGWVDWDEDGKPFGEGWRHFTERKS